MSEDQRKNKRLKERRKPENLDYEGKERRKLKRVKGIVVEYKERNITCDIKSAFLKDMSVEGLSISVTEKFELGTILALRIYLTNSEHTAEVEAQVRWVKTSEYFKNTRKEHFDVGLLITHVEEWDLALIEKYIEQHNWWESEGEE